MKALSNDTTHRLTGRCVERSRNEGHKKTGRRPVDKVYHVYARGEPRQAQCL